MALRRKRDASAPADGAGGTGDQPAPPAGGWPPADPSAPPAWATAPDNSTWTPPPAWPPAPDQVPAPQPAWGSAPAEAPPAWGGPPAPSAPPVWEQAPPQHQAPTWGSPPEAPQAWATPGPGGPPITDATVAISPMSLRKTAETMPAPVMPHMVEIHEPDLPVRRVEVHQELEVGRVCDGIIVSDAAASRRHMRIRPTADGLLVADLGSTNGTTVNDVRIEGETLVRVGDVIGVGLVRINVTEIMAPRPPDVAAGHHAAAPAWPAPAGPGTFAPPPDLPPPFAAAPAGSPADGAPAGGSPPPPPPPPDLPPPYAG
jgi:hypothetical protein